MAMAQGGCCHLSCGSDDQDSSGQDRVSDCF